MDVVVTIEGERRFTLRSGERLEFGREEVEASITDGDRWVSRHHGTIAADERGWSVEAVGSRCGVVVYDTETPSRLHIARGVGPVTMPFAAAAVVVEARGRRHVLFVEGPGAPGWSGAWASVLGETQGEGRVPPGLGTVGPWEGVRWLDRRTGRPLRWYQTLVAMCEPFFATPPVEEVPTDAELADRLGTTAAVVRKRLMGELRDELGLDAEAPHVRRTIVAIAIAQGLVTRDDLRVLDEPGDPSSP